MRYFWIAAELMLLVVIAGSIVSGLLIHRYPPVNSGLHTRHPDVVWMMNYNENFAACEAALFLMAPRTTEAEAAELLARYNECLIQMKVAI